MITQKLFLTLFLLLPCAVSAQTQERRKPILIPPGSRAPAQPPPATGTRQASISQQFSVGYTFGDRDVIKLNIERPGALTVQAIWQGSASRLALIFNGPGQVNYYAREDSGSPLKLSFQITPEILARGREWAISIVNFTSSGSASGTLMIEYPAPGKPLIITPPPRQQGQARGNVEQKILADGAIEARYPDGTIIRRKDNCRTIIPPNGGEGQTSCLYSQVMSNKPPALPADSEVVPWLKSYDDSLLHTIQTILKNDKSSIENLKRQESGKPLLETIRFKIKLLNTIAESLIKQ